MGATTATQTRTGGPADYHLLVDARVVHITKGPKENRFRPAIRLLEEHAALRGPEGDYLSAR